MDMKLTFSQAEMVEFLTHRGFNIKQVNVETDHHLHGSRFITSKTTKWVALWNEKEHDLEEAFRKELMHKLFYE